MFFQPRLHADSTFISPLFLPFLLYLLYPCLSSFFFFFFFFLSFFPRLLFYLFVVISFLFSFWFVSDFFGGRFRGFSFVFQGVFLCVCFESGLSLVFPTSFL